jgi:hypothetical protein
VLARSAGAGVALASPPPGARIYPHHDKRSKIEEQEGLTDPMGPAIEPTASATLAAPPRSPSTLDLRPLLELLLDRPARPGERVLPPRVREDDLLLLLLLLLLRLRLRLLLPPLIDLLPLEVLPPATDPTAWTTAEEEEEDLRVLLEREVRRGALALSDEPDELAYPFAMNVRGGGEGRRERSGRCSKVTLSGVRGDANILRCVLSFSLALEGSRKGINWGTYKN